MDFPEALRLLAKKAGVELRKQDPRVHSQKTRLIDMHKWIAAYWMKVFQDADCANKARDYLKNRGLSAETIIDFKIGFAPDSWDKSMSFLKTKGFNESEINQAGLIKRKNQGSGYYDRFRNRIIFPISDVHETIIGFGGRAMDETDAAKYLNSPQTMIYDKSFVVYGLDKARQAVKETDLAIFVEGYMDVISSHQAGVKNVVATSGTALTPGHIKLINRYTNNVAFCFDQDLAGQAAAQRSIDVALAEEMNIKIIKVLNGKDPDECIQKDPQLWQKSIEQAKPYMEFIIQTAREKFDFSNIEEKKKAAKEILTQVSKIQSKIEQDYWIKKTGEALSVNEKLLWEAMPKSKTKIEPVKTSSDQATYKQGFDIYKRLFGLAIAYPENVVYLIDSAEPQMIADAKWKKFYSDLILLYNKDNKITRQNLEDFVQNQEKDYFNQGFFNSLILLVQAQFENFSDIDIQNEIIFLTKRLKKDYFRQKVDEIANQIKELEKTSEDKEKIKKLFEQFQELTWQISQLD